MRWKRRSVEQSTVIVFEGIHIAKVEDGKIIDKYVEIKTFSTIEHGKTDGIRSIVLHRTDSSTADSTLSAYANGKKTGAHFLIAKDGHIYQTANMNKVCLHVGLLLPRCQIEKNCDQKELKTITALIHENGLTFSQRVQKLSRYETGKKYPLRYPSNVDSIGIEVVGKFWPAKKSFDEPTAEHFRSLKWLVDVLIKEYDLNLRNDVYSHGAIARKEVSEGAQLLQYLHSGAAQ